MGEQPNTADNPYPLDLDHAVTVTACHLAVYELDGKPIVAMTVSDSVGEPRQIVWTREQFERMTGTYNRLRVRARGWGSATPRPRRR